MGVIQKFNEGGIFMYFILAFAVLTVTIITERAIELYYRLKMPSDHIRKRMLDFISAGKLNEAESFAVTEPSSLGRVIAVGCNIRANGGGEEELQARMDEKLCAEISQIDKRTGFLAMFGNVATLLGLLGTISGMIKSFAAVASASPVDRATMLSRGISEAMNCTAFGLIVAIPALVAYAIFQNRTDRFVTKLTEQTTEIYHDLLFFTEAEETKRKISGARADQPLTRQQSQTAPRKPAMTV